MTAPSGIRILLVSTYELGHQPLHVASPAAALRHAGHDVRCLDVSVERWDQSAVEWADAVGFSVPMHTAMRLAMRAAQAVRSARPELPICLYGLYAPVSRDLTLGALADRVIAGEYEPALVRWVGEVAAGMGGRAGAGASTGSTGRVSAGAGDRAGTGSTRREGTGAHRAGTGAGTRPSAEPSSDPVIELGRGDFSPPARDLLPPLERYAHLAVEGEERLVGYVEASHGCVHRCRHCPVPVVYEGRIRVVGEDAVLHDVGQLAGMGARHITFGDPDFLNGVRHSLRIARALHERHPELTFDLTTKVEHVLEHRDVWPELADCGCLFVVSALETVNDETLRRLDKGHTTREAAEAIALLRAHGIELRPSFMPFTPWTTAKELLDLLDFVAANDLVPNVDPVQYTIRLLLPEGSLLLDHPELAPYLGGYDAERLTYVWRAAEPEMDELQARLSALVEQSVAAADPVHATFIKVREAVRDVAGEAAERDRREPPVAIAAGSVEGRPRLTEPWFC